MAERPDIILIVFDTARRDAFGPYADARTRTGAAWPRPDTPAFDQLASRGTLLGDARASACWTLPSHAAMFSGLLPRASGLIRKPGEQLSSCVPRVLDNRERWLPERLAAAGYETRAISTNLWISRASGFDLGFEQFREIESGRQHGVHSGKRIDRLRWSAQALGARVDDGAAQAAQTLERWARERAGDRRGPRFTFVNLIEAHSPYLPPRPFNPLGPLGRLRSAAEARRWLNLSEMWKACAGGFEVPAEAIERMRALYSASIRQLDAWLARVLEGLNATGALDETIVIVTSDHGENLGEGGLMGHSFSLDDRLTRVPFAWAGPGTGPLPEPFGLHEIPGAIAGAIGLGDHPWDPPTADPVLAEFDPPTGAGDERVAKYLGIWGLGPEAEPRVTSRLTSASLAGWKLVRTEPTGGNGPAGSRSEALFDLSADPLEAEPVAPASAAGAPVEALSAALDAASPDRGVTAAEETADAGVPEVSDEERRDLEERMRLLGYM